MLQDDFQHALRNFMNDFAGGDAVRHLADHGLSVTEITRRLSYPLKKELVAEMVWKHYLDTGRILLHEPDRGKLQRVTYVKDEGPYGRTSLRQVVETVDAPDRDYVYCDFGILMRQDPEGFAKKMQGLPEKSREYICDLPWPEAGVWHSRADLPEGIV